MGKGSSLIKGAKNKVRLSVLLDLYGLLVALLAPEGRASPQGLVCVLEEGQGRRSDFLLMPV